MAHRHFSHLLMIYPLALESWEDEQARPLIEKSVDHWAGLCATTSACTGYSHTAASIMSSIMGRADAAMGNITKLLLEREDGIFPASVVRTGVVETVPKKKGGMGPTLGWASQM